MIDIGTLELADIAIGSTPIEKAYIGSQLVWEKSSPLLYTEIEYLESTGTQYIETNVIPNANTGIYINVTCTNNSDTFIVGCRNEGGNTRWCIGHSSKFYYGYSTYATVNVSQSPAECWLNYLDSKKFRVKNNYGSDVTVNLPTLSFTPAYNIRLFGSAGVVASYSKWKGKIYHISITQGSDLIMDFIPVRVGQVGYMYDKVSGNLFGNSGTGSFTLGPDVT